MSCTIKFPVTMYNDNQAALANLADSIYSCKNKHMDIRVKMIGDNVGEKIETKYIKSQDNPSDALTKGLTRIKFNKCRREMNIVKDSLMLMFLSLMALNFTSKATRAYTFEKEPPLILKNA